MKIGIDASRLNLKEKTGTEWYSYYIIKNILDIDRDNQYFLFSKEAADNEFLKYDNVTNIVLDWKFNKFWTIIKLSFALRKYNVDLFFSPSHNLPFGKFKKMITWHDLGYEYYPQYYSKSQIISLKFGAKQLKSSDIIITPSYETKNDIIKKYKINDSKVFVIQHGIDFNKYQKIFSEEEIKNILNKHKITKDYLLFIGRLENKKNIETLIKAFDYLKSNFKNDLELVLLGKNGYGFDKISDEINNSSDYKNDIKIIGWTEENEKICLLKNAKIYLNFSHFEGFGMTLIEAMFSKVPILISDLKVFRELGIDDYCFCRNDYKDIAIKIDTLILNNELRNDIINKNYFESQKYNWKKSAEETVKIFQK